MNEFTVGYSKYQLDHFLAQLPLLLLSLCVDDACAYGSVIRTVQTQQLLATQVNSLHESQTRKYQLDFTRSYHTYDIPQEANDCGSEVATTSNAACSTVAL